MPSCSTQLRAAPPTSSDHRPVAPARAALHSAKRIVAVIRGINRNAEPQAHLHHRIEWQNLAVEKRSHCYTRLTTDVSAKFGSLKQAVSPLFTSRKFCRARLTWRRRTVPYPTPLIAAGKENYASTTDEIVQLVADIDRTYPNQVASNRAFEPRAGGIGHGDGKRDCPLSASRTPGGRNPAIRTRSPTHLVHLRHLAAVVPRRFTWNTA